jgi:tetratricopeptide (TPR) repeat protein
MRTRSLLGCTATILTAVWLTLFAVRVSRGSALPAAGKAAATPLPLYSGLGPVHHQVTKASPLAQKYFDQGLAFAYGFNHLEAERSFEQAARIEQHMAMAYWGIALVLGPNYNLPQGQDSGKQAFEAIKRALSLERNAAPQERDLIDALSLRYGSDGKGSATLDQTYATAMREVAHRYPDDLDVQTLFAESLMDLHPWQLWSIDGKPGPDTIEIVTTLETVLKKNPLHVGANHYYIHAVEASSDPSRAIPSADRLSTLAPAAGHLVHMPAHIYIRTGRFHDSALVNAQAIEADEAFFAASKEGGVYPLMYYTHNIHFLCVSEMIEGRGRDALGEARLLETQVPLNAIREMPMQEFLVPMPYLVEARFGQWNQILKEPAPPKDLPFTSAMWHYARGLAFNATRRRSEAIQEEGDLADITRTIPPDRPLGTSNHAKDVAVVAQEALAAEIASASGDHTAAIEKFTRAVQFEDALIYEEPPMWYAPVRQRLAIELLAAGRRQEAITVYREDLRINPGNPLSLYGLAQTLKSLGQVVEAATLDREFRRVWRYADAPPSPLIIAVNDNS